MTPDLNPLERVAGEATPGPWRTMPATFSPRIYILREDAGADEAAVAEVIDRRNALFIATFNPERVLSLLSALSAAEEERDQIYQANLLIREQQKEDFVRAETAEARALSAEEERDAWKQRAEDARYLGDNHHNAIACPQCNPRRIIPADMERRALSAEERVRVLEEERTQTREEFAKWMLANSYATGHGDTIRDLFAQFMMQHLGREGRARGEREALAEALDAVLTWAEENHGVEWPEYDALVRSALQAGNEDVFPELPSGGGSLDRSTGLNDVPSTEGEL